MKHYMKPEMKVSKFATLTPLAMSIGGTVSGPVGMSEEFCVFDDETDDVDNRFGWKW